MLQLLLTIIIFLIIVIPVGRYMYHISIGAHTFADPVFFFDHRHPCGTVYVPYFHRGSYICRSGV